MKPIQTHPFVASCKQNLSQSRFANGGSSIAAAATQAPKVVLNTLKAAPQGQMASMLVNLAAWQYVPSAIITPITEAQLLKHSGLPPEEQHHQVQKEVARQVTGAGLHFLQCYGSLGFKDALKRLATLSQQSTLNQASVQARGQAIFWGKLLQPLAKPLGTLFASEARETATSLGLLMAFNAVGYGILRPLITNGMFFGWLGMEDFLQQKHKPPLSEALPKGSSQGSSLVTSGMLPTLAPITPVAPVTASTANLKQTTISPHYNEASYRYPAYSLPLQQALGGLQPSLAYTPLTQASTLQQ